MNLNCMMSAARPARLVRPSRRFAPALAATVLVAAVAGCVPLQPVQSPQVEQVPVQTVATPAAAPAPATAPAPVPTPAPAAASPETLRALEQLTELKEELKRLLNAVEEIQFDRDREAAGRETIRWQQQNLFQDMDRRLLKLEQDTRLLLSSPVQPPPAPVFAPAIEPVVPDIGDSAIAPDLSGGGPADTAAAGRGIAPPAAIAGDAAVEAGDALPAAAVSVQEQAAYDHAFGLLKQSRYDDAIAAFQQLADTWPSGQLADDALYWQSEAQYVNREFEAALQGFTAVTARYPDSARVPEALLKIGAIQHNIGAYDKAAEVFRDILQRFPDHQVGTMAQLRLRRPPYTTQ